MNLEIGYDLDTLLGSVKFDYKLVLGENATGDTPMYWGDVVSGDAYYYYTDSSSNRSLQTCNFYFNSNISQDYSVISGKISARGTRRDSASGLVSPRLSIDPGHISIFGGSDWQYGVSLNPPYTGKKDSASIIIYNNDTGVGSSTPAYSALAPSGANLPDNLASTNWRRIHYTTSQTVHNQNSNVPYMPISGRTMSYNDLCQYIVNEYNEQNPEETINVDDLPPFDDSSEPTEDYQPFSLDYDEILGERELESILKETQYVLDTTPLESVEFPTIEIESIEIESVPSSVGSAVGEIFDISASMPSDLLTIWGGLAVFAVFFWWLTK